MVGRWAGPSLALGAVATGGGPGLSLGPDARKASGGDSPADELTVDVERAGAEPIRHTVSVRVGPERAFQLFTRQMGAWWPVDEYSRAVSESAEEGVRVERLEFQARRGGSLLEHMSDG